MKRFNFLYNGKEVWKTSLQVTEAAAKDLKHEDYIQRRFAIAAMHELHKQVGEAACVTKQAGAIVELMEDEDIGVRYWTMATLASLGSQSIFDHTEQIAAMLHDRDAGVRTYAAICLTVIGGACDAAFEYIPNLQECLEDPDPGVRVEATKALAEMIEAEDLGEVAEKLVEALEDRRIPIFRASSAEALGALGEAGLPFVDKLAHALKDQYPFVRQAAAKALGDLGSEAMKDTCVPLAKLAISDPVLDVKVAAAEALKQMDLAEALEHADPSFRGWACERVATLGVKVSTPLLDKLGELLQDDDAKVRYWSAWALGDIGAPALKFLPLLIEASPNDPDPETRVSATKACVKLNQDAAKTVAPDVAKSLVHEEALFRESAAKSIGALGQDAMPQARGLDQSLKDEDAAVRLAAVRAILNMGKPAVRICGASLGECSRTDKEFDVRKLSAFVLHEFGLAAKYGAPDRKGV